MRLTYSNGSAWSLPVVAHAFFVALTLVVAAAPVAAQTITLNLSDSARAFVAPNAKLTVPVSVDLTSAGSKYGICSIKTDRKNQQQITNVATDDVIPPPDAAQWRRQ
jgi:hypothetical protein